ncbi:DUF2062 domain-containing protein [Hahella sp. NBU794]|uniref:DUF2062 domain-containing protein n=1 Tax=Hahella sp. NBU794 TaxID=3422590 RepID=UPI003D6E17A7
MPKDFIKKWMPNPHKLKENKSLHFLGDILHEPNLWHINRHAIAKAVLVGVFCSFIPMPFQMVVAAFIAVWVNCNLPLAVALVWISNPVTMPPIFYFNYLVGAHILGMPKVHFEFELSFAWLGEKLYQIGLPLYFGSFICGLFFSVLGYVVVEYLWRRKIRHDWRKRQEKRVARRASGMTCQNTKAQ